MVLVEMAKLGPIGLLRISTHRTWLYKKVELGVLYVGDDLCHGNIQWGEALKSFRPAKLLVRSLAGVMIAALSLAGGCLSRLVMTSLFLQQAGPGRLVVFRLD